MEFKKILIVMILLISPTLYGKNFSVSNSTLSETSDITPLTLRLPSVFSYHIIKDITEFQISAFISNVLSNRRNIQFLNAVEYSNIAHALEMRMGGDMLYSGNNVLAALASLYPSFFTTELVGVLENNDLRKTEIAGLYLRDVEFHEYVPWFGESKWVIDVFVFGLITSDGQTLNVSAPCDRGCNQKLAEMMDFDRLYSQVLSRLSHSMSQSFEDLLVREDIPKDHTLTLYLKDLSSEKEFVDNFTDVERINIGVIVEDHQGHFVRQIDWIIERPELERIRPYLQESIMIPFHESAHALVRHALSLDDYGGYLSIERALYFNNNNWMHAGGIFQPIRFFDQWLQEGAVRLAGKVSEKILFDARNLEVAASNFEIIVNTFIVLNEVCSNRDEIYDEALCSLANDFSLFSRWLTNNDDVLLFEESPFVREVRRLIADTDYMAHNILMSNMGGLVRLTRLVLQAGSLQSQELQEFFQGFSFEDRLTEGRPVLEEQDRYTLLLDIGPDILNRHLSLLFSLDSRENIDRVRQSSLQDILREAERIEVPGYLFPFIRKEPMHEHIEQNYARGLRSLYLRETVNTFVSSLTDMM